MIALTFLYSCKKEHELPDFPSSTNTTGNGSFITTTICGTIVDESKKPVAGATITAHGKSTTTNTQGFFQITGVNAPEKKCYVRVNKAGYFAGSRSEEPVKNGFTVYRIMLLSDMPVYSFMSGSGGTATLNNGCQVTIPSNAVVDGSNTPYNGLVNMSVKHLDPTDGNCAWQMPGDLMNASRTSALVSYGMLNVELKDNLGQKLQIASGKQATLKTVVPSSLLSNAPASIPLWYFNETTGNWQNEGSAALTGGAYIGTVSHFSTWNCDDTIPPSYTTGRIVDVNGNGLSGITVTVGWGYEITDQQGYFKSTDPSGTLLWVEVEGGLNGGIFSSAYSVGPLAPNQTYNVGNITATGPSYVTGTIVDCSNNPVAASVMVSWNGGYVVGTTTNGNFTIVAPPNVNAVLYAYATNGFASTGLNFTTASAGNTYNANTVSACGTNINGANSYVVSGGSFNNKLMTYIYGPYYGGYYSNNTSFWTSNTYNSDLLWVSFPGNSTGTFNSQASNVVCWFKIPGVTDSLSTNINFVVTQYPNVGGLITGTYSGTATNINTNTVYTISNGKFSVIRDQ